MRISVVVGAVWCPPSKPEWASDGMRKLLVADLLCGAGGSSTGAERALDPSVTAWGAGVIEGEGSIQAYIRKRPDANGAPLIAVRVRVVMSDLDVVAKLRTSFGVGEVLAYRNTQGLGKKQLYRWDASSRDDVSLVCDAIYPWMGLRRRSQIDRLRELMAAHPPISVDERVRRTWIARRANAAPKRKAPVEPKFREAAD